MKDLLHIAIGSGGGLLRTAAVLTCATIRRVPVPPVVLGVCLLVVVVVLRCLAEEVRQGVNVQSPCSRLPFAAGQPGPDLLEQPAIFVRILERGKRVVGTTLGVATFET